MISWIFELLYRMLGAWWQCFTGLLGFAWKLFTALLNLGVRAVSALGSLLLSPLTFCADHIWDSWHGGWDLGRLFGVTLLALLIACGLLMLLAVGENLYRKYRNRN